MNISYVDVSVDGVEYAEWPMAQGQSFADVAMNVARAIGIKDKRVVRVRGDSVEKVYEVTIKMMLDAKEVG